jgi:NAD(P)-dependent dehydrogenase (short-subunit alcohol dehydrogenase family)
MNKTLIFGATGGVGEALARRLHAAGQQVILAARNPEKLTQLAHELQAPHCLLTGVDTASIEQAFQVAEQAPGTLTGVANCIGSILLKPAHLTTDDELRSVLDVNLFSSFAIVRSASKALRGAGGAIVLVSTAAAAIGMANHEAIAAAKAGVEGLARSAAATYASRNIRVNVVAPGLVQTSMSRMIWENETNAAASCALHALGRLGNPDDVASAMEWLLNPINSWITGQVLGVDGGLSKVLPRRKG